MNKVKFSPNIHLEKDLLKNLLSERLVKGHPVVIKLHFGEPVNPHAFRAEDVKPLIEAIKELGFKSILTENKKLLNLNLK